MSATLDDDVERVHDVRGCGRPMQLWATSADGLQAWWCRPCNVVKWDDHPGQGQLFDVEGVG